MTRCIIISPDAELRRSLELALGEAGDASLLKALDHYPQQFEFGRLIHHCQPDAVLIDLDDLAHCSQTAALVDRLCPGAVLIGVHWNSSSNTVLGAMRMGMREFVSAPFTGENLRPVLARVREFLAANRQSLTTPNHVYSFLPAKPGSGASTIALNTALSMSERLNGRTLLMDLDLSSGVAGFQLDLRHEFSVCNAFERIMELDDSLWTTLVAHSDRLDVLPTHPSRPSHAPTPAEVKYLLDFARNRYTSTVVDLPGNLDAASLEVMQESKRIYVVCTPEVASLRLAREKFHFLRQHDLEDRAQLVLNRAGGLLKETIREIVGQQIAFEFPNNYAAVVRAMEGGRRVNEMKSLFSRFAADALEQPTVEIPKRQGLAGVVQALTRHFSNRRAA